MSLRPSAFREPFAVFGVYSPPSCKEYPQTIAAITRKTGLALPGGKVRPGETPEEALTRKLRDELGIPDLEPVFKKRLWEAEVDGQLVRTYRYELETGADKIKIWATPDDLVVAQASRSIRDYNLAVLLSADFPLSALGEDAWIHALGSGTLRNSVDAGSAYRELYLHERCAFELGPEWDTVVASRYQTGRPLALGDTPQWTETLWSARRFKFAGPRSLWLQNIVPEWVSISDPDAPADTWEGYALIAHPQGLPWWPSGRVAVARLARWSAKEGRWIQ